MDLLGVRLCTTKLAPFCKVLHALVAPSGDRSYHLHTRSLRMEENYQNHPLYARDRAVVDRLLLAVRPTEDDLTNAGRLFPRYNGFPGALDIKADLSKCLQQWRMTREQLNSKCFEIWNSGYRPGAYTEEVTVGSGADSE